MPDTDLYDRHPINARQILDAVAAEGKDFDALSPADLRPHDQDHYGGEAVVHDLIRAAEIRSGHLVADICAGMAGPARLVAEATGASVIGLDYNWGRCQGAGQLNRMVRLDGQVTMVRCDAQALPLADDTIDAAISQEALLHIPDKAAVLTSVYRALKPGCRFAFTDLIANSSLSDQDRFRLTSEGMQMVGLPSRETYEEMAVSAGFSIAAHDDLSATWADILTGRLAMYDNLGEATEKVHGADAHRQYMQPYAHFVSLVQQGSLGGMRLTLVKPMY